MSVCVGCTPYGLSLTDFTMAQLNTNTGNKYLWYNSRLLELINRLFFAFNQEGLSLGKTILYNVRT